MGKSIIISGADFSTNRVPDGEVTPITITNLTVGATTGKYVNSDSGDIGTVNNAAYTRKIQCNGYSVFVFNTTFYFQHVCAFYDQNQEFISGIHESGDGNTSYRGAVPSGAYYIVLNYRTTTPPVSLTLE